MRRICSWCGTDLDGDGGVPARNEPITHGICRMCRDFLIENKMESMRVFLDRLNLPILLVDERAVVVTANTSARRAFGKELPEMAGCLAGDVMQCVYARLPGGCGKTTHCAACQIRLSVTRTYQTGEALRNVEAYQDVQTPTGEGRRLLHVSTEKIGETVLLRLDTTETLDSLSESKKSERLT